MLLRIRRLNENVLTSFQKVLTIYTAKFLDPQLDESPKKKTEKTQDEVFIAFAREVLEKYIDTIGNMFQQAASDFVRIVMISMLNFNGSLSMKGIPRRFGRK